MSRLIERARWLYEDEEGATMIEYALLVALIGVALIVTLTALRGGIATLFGKAQTELESAGE